MGAAFTDIAYSHQQGNLYDFKTPPSVNMSQFTVRTCHEFVRWVCLREWMCLLVTTLLNVLHNRLLALGWVLNESGPGLHMLWQDRSKRWKSESHIRNRWTRWHIQHTPEKVGKRTGWHMAADQMPSENGGEGWVCDWLLLFMTN